MTETQTKYIVCEKDRKKRRRPMPIMYPVCANCKRNCFYAGKRKKS